MGPGKHRVASIGDVSICRKKDWLRRRSDSLGIQTYGVSSPSTANGRPRWMVHRTPLPDTGLAPRPVMKIRDHLLVRMRPAKTNRPAVSAATRDRRGVVGTRCHLSKP